MDRATLDSLVAQAIEECELNIGEGRPSPTRLRHALSVLAQRVESATRSHTLLGLRTVDDLAAEFGVSAQRIRALAKHRHERFGVGMKLGKSWLWSAEEVEAMRPDLTRRPRSGPTAPKPPSRARSR